MAEAYATINDNTFAVAFMTSRDDGLTSNEILSADEANAAYRHFCRWCYERSFSSTRFEKSFRCTESYDKMPKYS